MPIYEYQCKKCSHRFERIQKFADAPVKTCPKCGGKVERLISSAAVQFKGTGFYATDYGRKSSGGEAKTEGGKTDAKPGADSKPAEKKESKSGAAGKQDK